MDKKLSLFVSFIVAVATYILLGLSPFNVGVAVTMFSILAIGWMIESAFFS